MGDNLFRLRDRFQRTLCLAMTHEEAMTAVARGELRSYKQLPQIWYQIQTKFRDEPRPRAGLLRVRQFRMKDSYSFDIDAAGLDISYRKHQAAYGRIFETVRVARHRRRGAFRLHGGRAVARVRGGFRSGRRHRGGLPRLRVRRQHRESRGSAHARPGARPRRAIWRPSRSIPPDRRPSPILRKFTGLPETSLIKSLVLVADGKPVLALLRGDHQLSHTKFAAASGDPEFRPAYPEEIQAWFGAGAGSLGPVGVTKMPILADQALAGRRNMVAGANRDDTHLRHVTPGEDFEAEMRDLREVAAGDCCFRCGQPLDLRKTIEVGHIFKLGLKYSEPMGLRVLNADGREVTPLMGSYGIGIERILCAVIETFHDQDGMILPPAIAPFQAVVTPANIADEAHAEAAHAIYRECLALGIDTLLDDRDERPGVKFKDADLIGVPFRVTVGRKLAGGMVELVDRKTRQSVDVAVAEAARAVEKGVRRHF